MTSRSQTKKVDMTAGGHLYLHFNISLKICYTIVDRATTHQAETYCGPWWDFFLCYKKPIISR